VPGEVIKQPANLKVFFSIEQISLWTKRVDLTKFNPDKGEE
jgi:hypothetical protein